MLFGKKKRGKGFIPLERVKELKAKNLPDGEIIQALMNEGFSAEEIDQALVQYYNLPKEVEKKEEKKEEKTVAPLFVKLDKYKQILDTLKELRAIIGSIKSSFSTLKEVEGLLKENLKIAEKTIQNFERKFSSLNSCFLKPASYEEETEELFEVKDLESSISQLKSQIEELKTELQSVSK